MTIKDIVKYYWSIPINLNSLAEYFLKATSKKELEYVSYRLKEMAGDIDRTLEKVT